MIVNHTSTDTALLAGPVLAPAAALLESNASIAEAEVSVAAVVRIMGIQWLSHMEKGVRKPAPKR